MPIELKPAASILKLTGEPASHVADPQANLGSIVLPRPVRPVVRADDLLSLGIEMVNLQIVANASPGQPPRLQKADQGNAFLILHFPPQAIADQTFFQSSPPGITFRDGAADQDPADDRAGRRDARGAADPRRVAGDDPAVLRRARWLRVRLHPGRRAHRLSVAGAVGRPDRAEARDAARAAHLSVTAGGADLDPDRDRAAAAPDLVAPCRRAVRPPGRAGRLAAHRPGRAVAHPARGQRRRRPRDRGARRREDAARGVDARRGGQPGVQPRVARGPTKPAPDTAGTHPYRMTLDDNDRFQIVHLSSNYNFSNYVPEPIDCDAMMLSALGGWLDSRGAWDPMAGLSVEEWVHRATMARDHYVRVVYKGFLLPFGHRASLIKVSERRFHNDQPGNPAYLRQRMYIVVRERERSFERTDLTDAAGTRFYHRMFPFSRVRITTTVTPDLMLPTDAISKIVESPVTTACRTCSGRAWPATARAVARSASTWSRPTSTAARPISCCR